MKITQLTLIGLAIITLVVFATGCDSREVLQVVMGDEAATPTPTPTPTSTPSPTPFADGVVRDDSRNRGLALNLRRGPGEVYGAPIMALPIGTWLEVLGRTHAAGLDWLKVRVYPDGPMGWVYADRVELYISADAIPLAYAPSTPTPPATDTPIPPPPPAGPRIYFTADRTLIAVGECTLLRWNVINVQEVYLDDAPVWGHDPTDPTQTNHMTRQVCPVVTTTYTLKVITLEGQTILVPVTVEVQ